MPHAVISRAILAMLLVPGVIWAQEGSHAEAATEIEAPAPDSTVVEPAVEAEPTSDAPTADASAEVSATEGDATGGSGLVGSPQAGMGQIVFFRPKKFAGGAIGFKVREGETELGKLRSGKYFIAAVEPGVHEYRVHSEAEDVLTMEVEDGETYYVQGTITMGVLTGRPNLSPSDAATFEGMADSLKLAE